MGVHILRFTDSAVGAVSDRGLESVEHEVEPDFEAPLDGQLDGVWHERDGVGVVGGIEGRDEFRRAGSCACDLLGGEAGPPDRGESGGEHEVGGRLVALG